MKEGHTYTKIISDAVVAKIMVELYEGKRSNLKIAESYGVSQGLVSRIFMDMISKRELFYRFTGIVYPGEYRGYYKDEDAIEEALIKPIYLTKDLRGDELEILNNLK